MDTWEASLESYFTGWRDGYAQALDDVDSVIDEQHCGEDLKRGQRRGGRRCSRVLHGRP